MKKSGFVYIITNIGRSTLYTGVTSNIVRRIQDHRNKVIPASFTARYNLSILVHYENFEFIEDAIKREKYIKGKRRSWKVELINSANPKWRDLYPDLLKDASF